MSSYRRREGCRDGSLEERVCDNAFSVNSPICAEIRERDSDSAPATTGCSFSPPPNTAKLKPAEERDSFWTAKAAAFRKKRIQRESLLPGAVQLADQI